MTKRIAGAIAAAVMMAGPAALLIPLEANAAAPGCVTRAEWRHGKIGMTKTKAHRILGTTGAGTARQRAYADCAAANQYVLFFRNNHVTRKLTYANEM